jgi:hypothetical protein
MVARTRSETGGLIVVFSPDGEEPQEMPATDSYRAAAIATTAIDTRPRFLPGDIVMCRLADDGLAPNPGVLGDLPEV